MIKMICVYLYVFLYLYAPPILSINITHILFLFSSIYLILNLKLYFDGKLRCFTLKFIRMGYFLVIYFMFLMVIGKEINFSDIYSIIIIFIESLPISLSIGIYCHKNKYSFEEFSRFLIKVGIIQAIISIITFLSPTMQTVITNHMSNLGYINIDLMTGHRLFGFSSTLTFGMPIIQSILSINAIYFSIVKSKKYIFAATILLMSSIINARIGIFIFLMGFIIVIMPIIGKQLKSFKGFISIIILFLGLFIIIPEISSFLEREMPSTFEWINAGINEFKALLNGEKVGYFEYIFNMKRWSLPEGINILIGNGYKILGAKTGVYSDIGFVNDIWLGGIIYLVILIILIFDITNMSLKASSKNILAKLNIIFIIIVIFVSNIKGLIFTQNEILNFFLLLNVFLNFDLKKGEKNEVYY